MGKVIRHDTAEYEKLREAANIKPERPKHASGCKCLMCQPKKESK